MKTYAEQQLPLGQSPHTVPSLPAPQVPSMVAVPVVAALPALVVGEPRTGSLLVAPAPELVLVPVAGVLLEVPSHPL